MIFVANVLLGFGLQSLPSLASSGTDPRPPDGQRCTHRYKRGKSALEFHCRWVRSGQTFKTMYVDNLSADLQYTVGPGKYKIGPGGNCISDAETIVCKGGYEDVTY
jgi:hypothetical protein